jgi:cholesterol transport system auxiliary component
MIRYGGFAAIGALLLSGCVNLDLPGVNSNTPVVYYVLEDVGRTAPAATPSPKTLVLVDTQTGTFYDNDGMAFSNKTGTRGYYQYARWTERPGKRFSDLLIARLELEKPFATTAQTGTNVHGDWLLTTDIVELYHDAVKQPGTVKMVLRAEVADLESRKLVSRKLFTQIIPASSYEAEGAYQAFNQAVTATLNELTDWLKTLPPKN